MSVTVQHAHAIKMSYHGATNYKPSRIGFTWDGWPSDDNRKVRKYISRDYSSDNDQYAAQGAQMFVDWLSAGGTGTGSGLKFDIISVIKGGFGDCDFVLVQTEASHATEEA